MFVAGCCKIAILARIWTWVPHEIEEKKLLPQGDLIRGPFACKRNIKPLCYSDNIILVLDLRRQILVASEMIFHFEKAILFIRFRVFVIFSKIPRGIWKISFYMLSYICILSKNHSRSLLSFFLIGTPTLSHVSFVLEYYKKLDNLYYFCVDPTSICKWMPEGISRYPTFI